MQMQYFRGEWLKTVRKRIVSSQNFVKKLIHFSKEKIKKLRTLRQKKLESSPDALEPWEVGFWSEKLKKERYDFDDEDLRPYFPIQSVLEGMFELATKVFGLSIKEKATSFEGKKVR